MEDPIIIASALSGDRAAMRSLIERLVPVIWSRVSRVVQMVRHRTAAQQKQLSEDLVQEVFVALLGDEGRALRAWDPERGMSLEGYVGLVATNCAASVMRSGRRSAWREDATEDETLSLVLGATSPESSRLRARDELARIMPRLREALSPTGWEILELLILEARSIAEVSSLTGLSTDALYAWRSRITRLATRIAADLDPPSS